MKPLRRRFEERRSQEKVAWEILEQDYLLSWILAGIAAVDRLQKTLVFKGGTALKKCYFGHYRFSQDLDFSVQGDYAVEEELEALVTQACYKAEALLQEHGQFIALKCQRYREKHPHPEQQEAFTIWGQYPWHRDFHTQVMIEVTIQEQLLLEPQVLPLLHGYGENLPGYLFVYPLEEIIAEKICAILQYAKKLHERGWGRSRARDYYDLWCILTKFPDQINLSLLPDLVIQKGERRKTSMRAVEQLFSEELMRDLEAAWVRWMSPIVPHLPDKKRVLEELRLILERVWAFTDEER